MGRSLSEPAAYLRRYGTPEKPYERPKPPQVLRPAYAPREQASAWDDPQLISFGWQAALARLAERQRRDAEARNLEACRTLGTCEGEPDAPFFEE